MRKKTLKDGDKIDIHSKDDIIFMTVVHKNGRLHLEYDGKFYTLNEIYSKLK